MVKKTNLSQEIAVTDRRSDTFSALRKWVSIFEINGQAIANISLNDSLVRGVE